MNLDIKIFSGDKQLVPKNDNVEVTLNDERRYSSIFFTVNNIISILKNYKKRESAAMVYIFELLI